MSGQNPTGSPWSVDPGTFPVSGSVQEQLSFCVNYAVLAPSIYNTQPWLFRPLEQVVELYADRSRQLTATDPHGREMVISCGAALANLQIALRYFGHESWVQYVPDPANPDLLARVRVGRRASPDYTDQSLFRSITQRRTSRQPFQTRPFPRGLLRRLIWKAMEYGCWLHLMESSDDREHLTKLVAYAQLRKIEDTDYQAEREHWSKILEADSQSRSEEARLLGDVSANGQASNGAQPGDPANGLRWIQRDRALIDASPAIFVLGTSGDSVYEWLRAGEAMQHVLLLATSENISASFLNQPCQIPGLREELRMITGRSGLPQVVIRMGYGKTQTPSPRRSAREVILTPG